MPFKSKSQMRWMFAAEARGDLPKGTAKRWARHTKRIGSLPEKAESDNGKEETKRSWFTAACADIARQVLQEVGKQAALVPAGTSQPGAGNIPVQWPLTVTAPAAKGGKFILSANFFGPNLLDKRLGKGPGTITTTSTGVVRQHHPMKTANMSSVPTTKVAGGYGPYGPFHSPPSNYSFRGSPDFSGTSPLGGSSLFRPGEVYHYKQSPEAELARAQEERFKDPFRNIPEQDLKRFRKNEARTAPHIPKPGTWYSINETTPTQVINENMWYRTFGYDTGGLLNTFKTLWTNPKFTYLVDANGLKASAYGVISAQKALADLAVKAQEGKVDPKTYRAAYNRYLNTKRSFLATVGRVQNELYDMQTRGFTDYSFDNYLTYKAIRAYEGFLAAKSRLPHLSDDDARAWVRAALRRDVLNTQRLSNTQVNDIEAALRFAEHGLNNYLRSAARRPGGAPVLSRSAAAGAPASGYVPFEALQREKSRLATLGMSPYRGYQAP